MIVKPKSSHFSQLAMKFYLYQNEFEKFIELWQKVIINYCEEV